jgi:hypothetical protein
LARDIAPSHLAGFLLPAIASKRLGPAAASAPSSGALLKAIAAAGAYRVHRGDDRLEQP